jgi:hypothetical protein
MAASGREASSKEVFDKGAFGRAEKEQGEEKECRRAKSGFYPADNVSLPDEVCWAGARMLRAHGCAGAAASPTAPVSTSVDRHFILAIHLPLKIRRLTGFLWRVFPAMSVGSCVRVAQRRSPQNNVKSANVTCDWRRILQMHSP